MYFISHAVQFGRQRLDWSLDEEDIGQAAFGRPSMNLLGDLLQRLGICVYPDVKFFGILASRLVYKEAIARPDVYHHSLAGGGDKLLEGALIQLSVVFTTNNL